jgi:CRP/FNR family transcriptional regulator
MFLALMREHLESAARRESSIPLPMTRSDIADFLGLSLETVSRAAAELERRGLVRFKTRHLALVLDEARLAKLVRAV